MDAPDEAIYYIYAQNSGQAPVITWYNNIGQELRIDTYQLDPGNDSETAVYVEKSYYSDGTIHTVSKPYYTVTEKENAVEYKYDELGRQDEVITPHGTTSYVYDGLTTTVTTPRSTKSETKNAASQVIESQVDGRKVTYTYYPSGLVKTSTPEGGVAVETFYDLQGNRTKIIDPDGGTIESEYNGLGELLWENYTKSNLDEEEEVILTKYTYDDAGRLFTVDINGEVTTHLYDQTKGFLSSVSKSGHEVIYTYDEDSQKDFGRITTLEEKIDGESFPYHMGYDALGRLRKRTFPSGYFTTNRYDRYSNLIQVKDKFNNNIWKALEKNAQGQFTRISKGIIETQYSYYSISNLPKSIVANGILSEYYQYHADGNLKSRGESETGNTGYKESFTYDDFNQLATWSLSKNGSSISNGNYSMIIDNYGNITNKSDLVYQLNYNDPDHIHAVSSIEGNPDMISDDQQIITYTDFKKVETITEGDKALSLTYGLDHQRLKGVFSDNGVETTRFYLSDYEEDHMSSGEKKKVHYIAGGNGLAAIYIESEGAGELYYAYTDYLGSLKVLTDKNGTVEQRFEFDPWGNRRNPDSWEEIDSRTDFLVDRGYTMHEHLDDFALINMNGRVYDPTIARFLSPDPMLQAPGNWLNYNRYAYCMNNPLIYTDPTGLVWYNPMDWFKAGMQWLNDNIAPSINEWSENNNVHINAGGGYNSSNGFYTYGGDYKHYYGKKNNVNYAEAVDRGINEARGKYFSSENARKSNDAQINSAIDNSLAYSMPIRILSAQSQGRDSDNWGANAKTAARMFWEWDQGVGPANRTFTNDRVANAMRNAWKVGEAREYFYNKYAGVTDLTGASVTNYSGKFGLQGLVRAGIDPIEQYVGSYSIDIHVIPGNMLQFTLTNVTSMQSFLYGIAPEWERSTFRLNGNTRQTYIFTEPIR